MEEVPWTEQRGQASCYHRAGRGRAAGTAQCPEPGPSNQEDRWRVKREKRQGAARESRTPLTAGPRGQPVPECSIRLPLSPLGEAGLLAEGIELGPNPHPVHLILGPLTPGPPVHPFPSGHSGGRGAEYSLGKGSEGTEWGEEAQEHQRGGCGIEARASACLLPSEQPAKPLDRQTSFGAWP